MRLFTLVLSVVFSMQLAAKGKLVSGPMQGHSGADFASVWLMVKNADSVMFSLKDESGRIYPPARLEIIPLGRKQHSACKFYFENLPENKSFGYVLEIDGNRREHKSNIRTLNRNAGDVFSFNLLSCALTPPVGTRFLHPGIENRTYRFIARNESDFTLWIGDYLYYFRQHYSSENGMLKRQIWNRKLNKVNRFLQTQPQFSIWDDHEYGHDNSTGAFPLKEKSLAVFSKFWLNPGYGTPDAPGCYFMKSHGDVDFFMMDNRYYRTYPSDSTPAYLGAAQLQWLKENLLQSRATFKFIASGSQALNRISKHECFRQFTAEFNDLMQFIRENNITGVIFFSGDRHHSELLKDDTLLHYPLYDFTSSGVTSFRRRTRRGNESVNPDRVPGKLADFQNFSRLTISGAPGNRACTIEVFRKRGKPAWTHVIQERELM